MCVFMRLRIMRVLCRTRRDVPWCSRACLRCVSTLQPEPYEFLKDKQQMVAQRVASTAAIRVARSFTSRQQSAALSSTQQGSHSKLLVLRSLSSLRHTSFIKPEAMPAHSFPAGKDQHAAAAADFSTDVEHFVTSPRQSGASASGLRQLSAKQLSLKLQRSMSITADGRLVQDAAWLQQDKLQAEEPEAVACEQEFQQEVRTTSICRKFLMFTCTWAKLCQL